MQSRLELVGDRLWFAVLDTLLTQLVLGVLAGHQTMLTRH